MPMDHGDFALVEGIDECLKEIRDALPTRRDLFAAAALQGLLAANYTPEQAIDRAWAAAGDMIAKEPTHE